MVLEQSRNFNIVHANEQFQQLFFKIIYSSYRWNTINREKPIQNPQYVLKLIASRPWRIEDSLSYTIQYTVLPTIPASVLKAVSAALILTY